MDLIMRISTWSGWISPKVIGWGDETGGRQASLRVGALGPPEEEDVGFGFVYIVVGPPSGLLHSQGSPFVLSEKLAFVGDFPVDLLGEDDVSVLVVVVEVLFGVLYFGGVVGHDD